MEGPADWSGSPLFARTASCVYNPAVGMGQVDLRSFLPDLTPAEQEAMLHYCEPCTFAKGEWLVREGTREDVFYLVTEGELEVLKESPFGGLEHLSAVSHPTIVGETALFTKEARRVASVRALTDGQALRLSTPALFDEIAAGQAWAYKIVYQMARSLANRLVQMNTRLVEELHKVVSSEGPYALAAHGTQDGIWDWDLRTNRISFSHRWKSMLGYADDEIGTHPEEWLNRVHPEDIEWVQGAIAAHLQRANSLLGDEHSLLPAEGAVPNFVSEHRMLHKDGSHRWMLSRGLALWDGSGKAYRMAGFQTDITDRKLKEEQLAHDAFHDPLSGLANRALFLDRVRQSIRRAKRRKDYQFAVLFLDLDRFKVLNDSLGHDVGDRFLFAVARKLEKCLREVDSVCRLGGDEFTLLLDDIKNPDDTTIVAERVQKELSLPLVLDGHRVSTSASIGIAVSSTGYDRPEELLRDADTAMYRAKALGKARHEIFSPAMHDQAVSRLNLELDLRQALEAREFCLHYQPIVSLETGHISGFEALLRWRHPKRGLVPPLSFIPLAEETGLIISIGQWALREACRQIHAWRERFRAETPLVMSVNLSGKQLIDPSLPDQVDGILRETGIEPDALNLEITESMLMESTDFARASISKLRDLRVRLLIDDFGTGYSSLSYLQDFPFNTLKIDRSFVNRLSTWRDSPGIINAIITLAHNIGLDVIAEGVETEQQLSVIKALGCEYCQGYFFYRPMEAQAVEDLLAQRPASPPWASAPASPL